MTLISLVITCLGVYLAIGALFASVFVVLGVQKTDAAASGAGPAFRLLILPGCAALWPLLAFKWARRSNHTPHGPADGHGAKASGASGPMPPKAGPVSPARDWTEAETTP